MPIRLTLILTNKCNLKCANCFEKDQLNKQIDSELTLPEWLKIIDSLSRFTIVDILGGEAFLYRHLDQILAKCKEKKVIVALTTNATFMSPANIQKLIENDIYYLMISVDGLGKTHDDYRGRRNHFEQIVTAIKDITALKKKLGKTRPFLSLKFLIMNENIHEMIDFINYFENIEGVDEIKFNFVTQKKYWYELLAEENLNSIFADSTDRYTFNSAAVTTFEKNLNLLKDKVKNSHIRIGFQPRLPAVNDYVDYLKNKKSFAAGICYIPRSNFTILSDGEVIPCLSYRLGNMREFGYNANRILFSDKHRDFIKKQKAESLNDGCRGCVTKNHLRLPIT